MFLIQHCGNLSNSSIHLLNDSNLSIYPINLSNKFIHHLHCRFFHSSIYSNSSIFPLIHSSIYPIDPLSNGSRGNCPSFVGCNTAPIHLFIQFIRVSLSSSWKQVTNQERQGDELVNLRFFLNMKRILQNFMKWSHLREGVWKCSWWRLWPSCLAGVYASRFRCAAAAVSYSSAWLTTWILEDKLHFQFSLSLSPSQLWWQSECDLCKENCGLL